MKRMMQKTLILLLAALCVASVLPTGGYAEEVSGNETYCFTGAEFVYPDAGELEGIYVSSVPDADVCVICMGERVIRAGDFLPYACLDKLTLAPTCDENVSAAFCYRSISQGRLEDESIFTMQIKSSKNEAPTAEDVTLETYKNIANEGQLCATDPDGDTLCYQLEDKPRQGTVELGENGAFVYTPKKNKVGEDSFSYSATDTAGNVSNTATVHVKILQPLEAETFDDMEQTAQFLPIWMRENGLYSGTRMTDKLCFCPEETVTRGEFLAMSMELAGIEPEIGLNTVSFDDAQTAPKWMQPYLSSALRRGIALGIATETGLEFRPNTPITAAEAAAILSRSFRLSDALTVANLNDSGTALTWAERSVASLQSAGIAVPYDAEQTLSRSDAAELLYAVSKLGQ